MSDIHIILTGGTIDFSYYPVLGKMDTNEESIIPEYIIDKIKPYINFSFETISMLDSDDINTSIRKEILHSILKSKADKIIITHGTNTMEITAQYIKENIGSHNKTIIS